MIAVSPQSKIFIQPKAIDFRSGIDGLVARCREVLKINPFSGALFVFRNKKGTAIKILFYDSQGFWLAHKRFSEGKLKYWPTGEEPVMTLAARELHTLLWNGNPCGASFAPDWRGIS